MPKGKQVTFRVDDQEYALLEQYATTTGFSPGQCARQLVLDTIHRVDEEQHAAELRRVRLEVRRIRDDLLTSVEALLCMAGKVSQDDAARWVEDALP